MRSPLVFEGFCMVLQPVAWKRFHRIFKRRYFRINRPSFTTRKSLRTAKGLTTALSIPIGRKTQTLENCSPKQKNRCNRWVFAGHTPLLRSFAESKKFLRCSIKLVFTAECIGLPGCPHHEEIADIGFLKSYPAMMRVWHWWQAQWWRQKCCSVCTTTASPGLLRRTQQLCMEKIRISSNHVKSRLVTCNRGNCKYKRVQARKHSGKIKRDSWCNDRSVCV